MLQLKNKKILVLAPHTDDGELGCGATISRALSEGSEVYYVAFSTAEDSLPPEFPRDQLVKEVKEATSRLGIDREHLIIYNYEVRKLNYHRQQILEDLVQLNAKISPDIVLMPSTQDIHQDHITISQEATRAFKYCTLLGYELPWNNLSLNTDCFISVTEEDVRRKIFALEAYITQRNRKYMGKGFLRSLAVVRGVQSDGEYAEAFEVIRVLL